MIPLNIEIKRIYDLPSKDDRVRILVDRIWPRGIKKADAKLDLWIKEIAPSTELRKWFSHKPELFAEFSKKYEQELINKQELMKELKDIARNQGIILLYAAKDLEHNRL